MKRAVTWSATVWLIIGAVLLLIGLLLIGSVGERQSTLLDGIRAVLRFGA